MAGRLKGVSYKIIVLDFGSIGLKLAFHSARSLPCGRLELNSWKQCSNWNKQIWHKIARVYAPNFLTQCKFWDRIRVRSETHRVKNAEKHPTIKQGHSPFPDKKCYHSTWQKVRLESHNGFARRPIFSRSLIQFSSRYKANKGHSCILTEHYCKICVLRIFSGLVGGRRRQEQTETKKPEKTEKPKKPEKPEKPENPRQKPQKPQKPRSHRSHKSQETRETTETREEPHKRHRNQRNHEPTHPKKKKENLKNMEPVFIPHMPSESC